MQVADGWWQLGGCEYSSICICTVFYVYTCLLGGCTKSFLYKSISLNFYIVFYVFCAAYLRWFFKLVWRIEGTDDDFIESTNHQLENVHLDSYEATIDFNECGEASQLATTSAHRWSLLVLKQSKRQKNYFDQQNSLFRNCEFVLRNHKKPFVCCRISSWLNKAATAPFRTRFGGLHPRRVRRRCKMFVFGPRPKNSMVFRNMEMDKFHDFW